MVESASAAHAGERQHEIGERRDPTEQSAMNDVLN
jgi:hypothetical protein